MPDKIQLSAEEMRVMMCALFAADTIDSEYVSEDDMDAAVTLHDKLADHFSRLQAETAAEIIVKPVE